MYLFYRRFYRTYCLIVCVGCLVVQPVALASEWIKKKTDSNWTWFGDYMLSWAKYKIACEPNRQCQVGVGIFAFGEPRGEKVSFSSERDILVVGVGSIHIRPADGKGPVKAAVSEMDRGLISISWDF